MMGNCIYDANKSPALDHNTFTNSCSVNTVIASAWLRLCTLFSPLRSKHLAALIVLATPYIEYVTGMPLQRIEFS